MDNRKARRAKKSAFKKELKNAVYDSWDDLTSFAKENITLRNINYGPLIMFKKNSIYSVQVYDWKSSGMLLAGIRRHDQKPCCPWIHKQKIKNELFGKERFAVEIFPEESKLVDEANIYWLWIFPEGERLSVDLV